MQGYDVENHVTHRYPWYISGGVKWPVVQSNRRLAHLWPNEKPESDRITDQLMFVPPNKTVTAGTTQTLKKIASLNPFDMFSRMMGRENFIINKCPVHTCTIVGIEEASTADAVFFNNYLPKKSESWTKPPNQVWILYTLESPFRSTPVESDSNNLVNWTANYRWDSDVVTPYEHWEYYDENVKRQPPGSPASTINYAANKTKKVAWFVSNCNPRNNRMQYAQELNKHITVDIFGLCGTKKCPTAHPNSCFTLLKDYKFYLSFENANCQEYITEKFFNTGLGYNVIPIVMGARPEDYKKSAPLNSYIHTDDFKSPAELGSLLRILDTDDNLYNEYFQWKGTGEFISTYLMCRVCAMLHDPEMPRKNYDDYSKWWGVGNPETCIRTSWREHRAKKAAARAAASNTTVHPVSTTLH